MDKSCNTYLIEILSRAPKTEKAVRKKLYEKGYAKSEIDTAVSLAKEYGYLSDQAYADSYIELKSASRGIKRIKNELRTKGVPQDIIDNVDIDESEQLAACKRAYEKFIKTKNDDPKLYEKAVRHLAYRGFPYDIIKRIIGEIDPPIDE